MTQTAPDWYSFTAHKPIKVESLAKYTYLHQTGTVWPDTSVPWTWLDIYTHRIFFAATKDATIGAWGIRVAIFENTMWLGGTTHVKKG
jgi:hypothetical protein